MASHSHAVQEACNTSLVLIFVMVLSSPVPGEAPGTGAVPQLRMMVNVVVGLLMSTALLLNCRLLNVTEPTAGPWPASGSGLAQTPKPDLASNWSPLFCAPLIVMVVNTVSLIGFCGAPPT